MNLHAPLLAITLLATATAAHAELRRGPATTGTLHTPASRIVGVWANTSRVGECAPDAALGPPQQQTLMFNSGGTFVDNSRFPPGGIPTPAGLLQRSIGLGTWRFDPTSGQYTLRQQFDFYRDNVYDGYMVIERGMQLSNDGNQITGSVDAKRYSAADALLSRQCGVAVSTRL
jgi:hypothetical protein